MHDFLLTSQIRHPHEKNSDVETWLQEKLSVTFSDDTKNDPRQKQLEIIAALQSLEEDEAGSFTEKLEHKMIPVLAQMEAHGVWVDDEKLADIEAQLQNDVETLTKQIFATTGRPINLNSPKQLQAFLFEDMGIQPIKKTKTGWSTDEETLSKLAEEHEVCRDIMTYRHVTKLLNTYATPLRKARNAHTNRIHTTYTSMGAATGRMSSDSPNLQNIPFGDPTANAIKSCFQPENTDTHTFLVADYSQVELRILAHLSGDENLTQVFLEGKDIHQRTAEAIFETSDISAKQRSAAKAVNFGVIYGVSGFGLGKMLNIDPKEAKDYIDAFYAAYPDVRIFYDELLEKARENGYVETFTGRKRLLRNINDKNSMARAAAEREAMNHPMQGANADIIKMAMIDIHNWLSDSDYQTKMLLQVHDELVFEVPHDEVGVMKEELTTRMSGVVDWEIPLLVEVGEGDNWFEAK